MEFINFRFSRRKSSKKDYSFYDTVLLKNLTHFTNLNLFNIVKIMLPQHSQKPDFTHFPANMLLVGVRKNICTAPFLDTQELHSQSTWKANICIFLHISVRKYLFQRRRKLLTGRGLNNFLKSTCALAFVKYFKIFHFNWNFWKFQYFSAFRYFHQ